MRRAVEQGSHAHGRLPNGYQQLVETVTMASPQPTRRAVKQGSHADGRLPKGYQQLVETVTMASPQPTRRVVEQGSHADGRLPNGRYRDDGVATTNSKVREADPLTR